MGGDCSHRCILVGGGVSPSIILFFILLCFLKGKKKNERSSPTCCGVGSNPTTPSFRGCDAIEAHM
jgi:hypothetical protein